MRRFTVLLGVLMLSFSGCRESLGEPAETAPGSAIHKRLKAGGRITGVYPVIKDEIPD